MPHASHRLDVIFVFEHPLDEQALKQSLVTRLLEGGFRTWELIASESPRFYSNHQGGFSVRCPTTQGGIVRPFSAALTAFRGGGSMSLHCPECTQVHSLGALQFRPAAAFGRGAVALRDVTSAHCDQDANDELRALFGPFTLVYRRVS